jgi:uncharacterized protein DUF29
LTSDDHSTPKGTIRAKKEDAIEEAKFKVQRMLENNPSLKPKLKDILREAYYAARLKAVRKTGLEEETLPEECPWNLREIFLKLEKKYC